MKKVRVVIWNEFVHEREEGAAGDYIRTVYPAGIHACLAEKLAAADLEIRTATLDEPGQGLPEPVLDETDVLVWWGIARTTGSMIRWSTGSSSGFLPGWGWWCCIRAIIRRFSGA